MIFVMFGNLNYYGFYKNLTDDLSYVFASDMCTDAMELRKISMCWNKKIESIHTGSERG